MNGGGRKEKKSSKELWECEVLEHVPPFRSAPRCRKKKKISGPPHRVSAPVVFVIGGGKGEGEKKGAPDPSSALLPLSTRGTPEQKKREERRLFLRKREGSANLSTLLSQSPTNSLMPTRHAILGKEGK